jgi:hypothetical protein
MVNKRLEQLRETIKAKKKRKQSRERKEKAKQAGERFASRRRVERNDPDTRIEQAKATARQAKLLASELGVTEAKAKSLTDRFSDTLQKAAADGNLGSLDIDGDGDTDLLSQIDPVDTTTPQATADVTTPTADAPVVDLAAGANDPVLGIDDADIDLGDPTMGEVTFEPGMRDK